MTTSAGPYRSDSTVVRDHQHFAGARKKRAEGSSEPADHALVRSRGRLSAKVHLAADDRARPLALTVTAGQAGDAPAFEVVIAGIRVPRSGPGRPRTGRWPCSRTGPNPFAPAVPPATTRDPRGHPAAVRPDRSPPAARPPRRPPARLRAETHKQRNTVERCINRLKQWRGLATRCDKLALAYQAALHLAAIFTWARR